MSDPCAELRPAVKALLRMDPGVMMALGGAGTKVVDFAPANLVKPYVILGPAAVDPEQAECVDGSGVELTIDVFSLTSPPSFAEAARISAAVASAIVSSDLVLASHRVTTIDTVSARQLVDADTVTAHAVLVFRFHTEALSQEP